MKRLRLSLAILGLAMAFTLSACSNSATPSASQWIAPVVQSINHTCKQAGATHSECGCAVKYVQDHYDPKQLSSTAALQTAMRAAIQSCATGS